NSNPAFTWNVDSWLDGQGHVLFQMPLPCDRCRGSFMDMEPNAVPSGVNKILAVTCIFDNGTASTVNVIQRGAWRRSSYSSELRFEDDLIDFPGEVSDLASYKGARHIGVESTQVRTEVDGDQVTFGDDAVFCTVVGLRGVRSRSHNGVETDALSTSLAHPVFQIRSDRSLSTPDG